MLCKTCENLPTPTNVAGSCRKDGANTAFFAYKLCSDCSEALDQCERCEAPLNASSSPVPGTGPTALRVTLRDKDNGVPLPGMHPGEEIVVILEEDQYSQTEWGVRSPLNYMFRLVKNNGFTPYAGQYQKGTRELIFEVQGTGNAELVLEEKIRTYSWYSSYPSPSTSPAPNGKTWKVKVDSK
jgi:hypothetical protein